MFRKIWPALLLALVIVCPNWAQELPQPYQNFGAVGMSYNPGAATAVAGNAAYARRLSDSTFSFTLFDALPNKDVPNTVLTNVSSGILQRVASIRQLDLYVPAAAGISVNGPGTGWVWQTGGLVAIPVKSTYFYPNVRVVKSSVGNGTGYQLIIGVMFGAP